MTYQAGDTFEVNYPFIRSTYAYADVDGYGEAPTWRPGVRAEQCAPDDFESVADGIGRMVLSVVMAVHPKPFPPRIFYTRKWVSPAGTHFGKRKLHCLSTAAFTRLRRGYRHHFRVVEKVEA